ncbi:hypothetical protein GXP70_12365 [Paenibacillus lycopersici]|uniref:Phage ABA sandwich domain-containing protein n=1 Tax=Paenibacillus lycopersici TaxID=2704462 RepID=A0A6C0FZK8_9BACL|nr:hypothetical protein [Paenibacillus lycopersici]QHT60654.1 hypothetical protein GXP70_12365 [Paenibacillus lycopersici]
MSDRQIDRQIAELMGEDLTGFEWPKSGPGKSMVNVKRSGFVEWKDIPYYSSDWNAMRLLVEWLQGKGFKLTLKFNEYNDNDWSADLWNENEDVESYEQDRTAPLALCNAVLSLPPEVLK